MVMVFPRPRLVARLLALLWIGMAAAHAATVDAAFTSATVVPVTTGSYDATGNDLRISLGFAPPRGTALTVVRNTGSAFLNSRFSNLKHGQLVKLAHNGTTYRFIANYYGGSGRDLVLEWAFQGAYAWGNGQNGQLGRGSSVTSAAPVAVTVTASGPLAGKTVVRMAAGDSHSLALCADGTVAAWGLNTSGQLGNDSIISSNLPVLVAFTGALALKTPVAIAAGAHHNLVLFSDGTVASWGSNAAGQLGTPTIALSSTPVAVSTAGALAGKTVISIAAGENHSLVACSDGTLVAWGLNNVGQLGNGTLVSGSPPVGVSSTGVIAGKVAVSVAAGDDHSLALFSDGSLAGWGSSNSGQLGSGFPSGRTMVPVNIPRNGALSNKSVKTLTAGGAFSLVATVDGIASAWGDNTYGSLGDGIVGNSSTPVAVKKSGTSVEGKAFTSVAAGKFHSLALCSDGTIAAWGVNTHGELGNASLNTSGTPVTVVKTGTSAVLKDTTPVAIAAGGFHSLAVAATAVINPTNESSLTQLTLGGGPAFSPAFTSGHITYQTTVPNLTSTITLTPTAANSAAKVTINNATVASGSASAPIPLNPGSNSITVKVMAPDNIVSSTYFITVTRTPVSNDPSLSALTVSGAVLSPAFNAATSAYSTSVASQVASVTVTPTATVTATTITVNGNSVVSGSPSPAIPLAVGSNTLLVRSTAQDGATVRNYTLTITRAAVPGSYEAWLIEHSLPADTPPLGDPDHDGFPTLLEYVLAGDPLAGGSPPAPVVSTDPSNFVFRFNRRASSASGTAQVFEISEDLQLWSPISITPPTAANVALGSVTPEGNQPVVVTVPREGRSRLVGRLRVTRP